MRCARVAHATFSFSDANSGREHQRINQNDVAAGCCCLRVVLEMLCARQAHS